MLKTMTNMLEAARREKYAVGAFEFWSFESAQAVVRAAEKYNVPVILQVGPFEREYMGGYANARKIAEMAAAESRCDVALHLDHSESFDDIHWALDCGFTSVMIDASALPYAENADITRRVVEVARRYGASVEAELGRLGGQEGNVSGGDGDETDPCQAASFVAETDIDALAVAIGTAHGFYTKPPVINIPRLKEIAAAVSIPLVMHGGSGTPSEKVREAAQHGIAKVNICTEFIAAFGRGYQTAQSAEGFKYNVFTLFRAARDEAQRLAEEKIRLFLGK